MSASYIGSFLMGQQITELQVALDAEKAKTATLETWASDRVKYAYPNGGSEGDEKQLSLDSVYYMSSPFPAGVGFSTYTEYFSETNNEWVRHQTSFYFHSGGGAGGHGCLSYPRVKEGGVVVTTGAINIINNPENGGGWNLQDGNTGTQLKWRVCCVRED
ncbi:hypothetical protein [Marinomonas foliarum]|uniref:Uncharacterized protein n=1 Tax=Marinomonas foliarum TaxID=491950 RepID=A0A369AHZ5_9GAMM|nr:hypothetical protein [Marinomonas foliarum]RCX07054.1 hypothetical protein DFP77_107154 [Marinomonas foliarum]